MGLQLFNQGITVSRSHPRASLYKALVLGIWGRIRPSNSYKDCITESLFLSRFYKQTTASVVEKFSGLVICVIYLSYRLLGLIKVIRPWLLVSAQGHFN